MNPSLPNQSNQPGAPGMPQYVPGAMPQPQAMPGAAAHAMPPHVTATPYGAPEGSIENSFAPDPPHIDPTHMQIGQQPGQPVAAPIARTNPNSTQNTLQIAEIRDGIVIMNDGSYRSVIMVKS